MSREDEIAEQQHVLDRFQKRLEDINGNYWWANLSRMAENLNDIRDTLMLFENVPEAQQVAHAIRPLRDSLRLAVDTAEVRER